MTSPGNTLINVRRDIPLSPLTSIHLGGNAAYFVECGTVDDIKAALRFATEENIRVHILGGGSNTIFADAGFSGLVMRINLMGVQFVDNGTHTLVTAAAGEDWDRLVHECIKRNLAGIECLSGIPGLVGATPIQNVGAYGQEVRETIVAVKALDRHTLDIIDFPNSECGFGYRQSRFKSTDAGRYVVVEVTFRLERNGVPSILYGELQKAIGPSTKGVTPTLAEVRDTVLALRRRKSMVLDPADVNTRSVGSFFTNPILSPKEFNTLKSRLHELDIPDELPVFAFGADVKVPAAWLIERAGFHKGYRFGNVGVSRNHSLALVNLGGSTRELLDLAHRIQATVEQRFGVRLDFEPVVVPA